MLELKTKDINFELRKLIPLNFPALFHILCSDLTHIARPDKPVKVDTNLEIESISDHSSESTEEIDCAVGTIKLRKVSLSSSSDDEEHKTIKKKSIMRRC